MIAGALAGVGVIVLVAIVGDRGPSGAVALGRLDQDTKRWRREALLADSRDSQEAALLRRLGSGLAELLGTRGVSLGRLASDLSVTGSTIETHLGVSVLAALAGMAVPILAIVVLTAAGQGGVALGIPVALLIAGAVLGGALPTLRLRQRGARRRRDFRHTVGVFLDLVSLNLAGGRGVPEALTAAARVGDGTDMRRLRTVLDNARLQGTTPWAALGDLGEDVGIDELVDLAAALGLVAEDGAKVRESLAARAATVRRRELADLEGIAQERSQSMLVAQLLLAAGFLLFLMYPAVARVAGAL